MTKEALKLAVETLEFANVNHWWGSSNIEKAITVIKEAFSQPEQEPVAWISPKELLVMRGNAYGGAKDWRVNLGLEPEEGDIGLYTTPSQRTWIGLTDGDIAEIYNQKDWDIHTNWDYERAIEAKLKEKNS